mgnify:FL=1
MSGYRIGGGGWEYFDCVDCGERTAVDRSARTSTPHRRFRLKKCFICYERGPVANKISSDLAASRHEAALAAARVTRRKNIIKGKILRGEL